MMVDVLPTWVETAMVVMSATSCRERLKKRWHEIELDVLPNIDALSDTGKRLVFEQALWVPIYFNGPAIREAYSEMRDLNNEILENAIKLIDLLSRHDELMEEYGLLADIPSLWRTIEKAASRYPHWYAVSKAHGGMNDFIRVATGQSAVGPRWIDLLDEFVNANGGIIEGEQIEIISSRKSTADFSKALLRQLEYLKYDSEHFPVDFKLTDQAIATLANVLGEMDPMVTSNGIKALRNRIREKTNR